MAQCVGLDNGGTAVREDSIMKFWKGSEYLMTDPIRKSRRQEDPVNHPSHYTDGQYETIDFIEAQRLEQDFYSANAVKYISRAGKKGNDKEKEDIQKAIWYLKRKKMRLLNPDQKSIPIKVYIKDKGLDETLKGLAIGLIANGQTESAIDALELYLKEI